LGPKVGSAYKYHINLNTLSTTGHMGLSSPLRQNLIKWVNIDAWSAPFAVTFTFRQCVIEADGLASRKVWLTETLASQNLRHFLNKLDRSVYGKAAERFGKRVPCFPVLEGSSTKRLHYHALIDCPREELTKEFPRLIAQHWRDTQWGYWHIDCQKDANEGWLSYMTKARDKPNLADAIDWTNVRKP
jgi:hypothetical protein